MEQERERAIGFELKAVNNLIRRKLDIRFASNELGELAGMQGPIVGYIHFHSRDKDVFQKDIEQEFKIRRSTATVMLQGLEQKGFIVRQPVEYDARLKKIVLTEKAVQDHMRIRQQIEAFHEELEAGITPEEKQEFFRILDKISANLTKNDVKEGIKQND